MSDGGEAGSLSPDRVVGTRRAAAALGAASGGGLVLAAATQYAPSLVPGWVYCGGGLYLIAAYVLAVGLGAWAGAGPLWAAVAMLPGLVAGPTRLSVLGLSVACLTVATSYGLGVALRRAVPLTTGPRRVVAVGACVAVFLAVALAITWVLHLGSGSYQAPQVRLEGTYYPDNRTLTVRHARGETIHEGRVTVRLDGDRRGVRLVADRTNTTGVWYRADAPAAATGPLAVGDAVHVRDVAPATAVRVIWSGRADRCSPSVSTVLWERDAGT